MSFLEKQWYKTDLIRSHITPVERPHFHSKTWASASHYLLSLEKPRDLIVSSYYHGFLQNSSNEGQLTFYQIECIKHIREDKWVFQ